MTDDNPPIAPFTDPLVTATGERRAEVVLTGLRTLWFNTGTLCNIACVGCYIESSPANDRLAYLTADDVASYLDEAGRDHPELEEVAFTGGEPFMNRALPSMLRDALGRGYRVLVLTNAMRPMRRFDAELMALLHDFPGRLLLRVSLDHHGAERHEAIRGAGTWAPAMEGLGFLAAHGFSVAIAGRTLWDEDESSLRLGYGRLFEQLGLPIDCMDSQRLVLFPEMESQKAVPEITESCWGILGKTPDSMMCASSRMVVKRRDAARAVVISCTLLPYDPLFELGGTLRAANVPVRLNHRFCAEFCVLGGGSCSPG